MAEIIGNLLALCVVLAIGSGAIWLLMHIAPFLIGIGVVIIVLFLIVSFIGFLFSDKPSEKDKQKFIVTNDNFNDDEEKLLNINTTMPNYYELLGVSKIASLDEIINAYENKKAAIIDDYGTATNKKGKKIFEAYSILSSEISRVKYDEEYKQYLHQNSGVYNNLVPMMKKNETLYDKTDLSNKQLDDDILVDSEEKSKAIYHNWKRALIIGFGIVITHILFKYFTQH